MSEIIRSVKNHRSIRKYSDREVSKELINEILETVQHAPNSINGQQSSVIIIRDKETKEKFVKLTGGQPWIGEAPVFLVFVADFHKTDIALSNIGKKQIIEESAEGLLVGATDVGIMLGSTVIVAEALGLGTVCIGGIRNNPEEVIKLLNLPPKTFPIAGLVLGYSAENASQKPRLPLSTFIHEEKYNGEKIEEEIKIYDETMNKYFSETNLQKEINWSNFVGKFYNKIYYPNVYTSLKKQGFKMDK